MLKIAMLNFKCIIRILLGELSNFTIVDENGIVFVECNQDTITLASTCFNRCSTLYSDNHNCSD